MGRRADETPGWAAYAEEHEITSTSKIPDGREIGTLSFYVPSRNEVYISVHHPGGSVNVYTHELGHAIDFQWQGGGKTISNDPEWVKLHEENILNNESIYYYYRTGSNGTALSGRKELFAEGFAIYNQYGYNRLVSFVGSKAVADKIIEIWTKYGVIK
ncbi:peptidase [Mycobacterium phage EagleEye]|uniref:Metalloprotease n=1 Tax=Mycobacterium phage EagleEye TaxID=1429759 RepID=W0LML8_9CAUD|nr:peptidase [Mycobacterium phage EagleEye]AHG23784.1 hypothetical protein PBI_EAGLEEYE_2 [Mycobacterium phage EagleEye]QDK03440.1 metalloprotease [Mycobacterium phage Lucyedi]QNJ55875.1 metalloprotease [Mycobacterium phage PainterBoy]